MQRIKSTGHETPIGFALDQSRNVDNSGVCVCVCVCVHVCGPCMEEREEEGDSQHAYYNVILYFTFEYLQQYTIHALHVFKTLEY